MLAAGLPIIAICPHWSDLAAVIRHYGVGFVISNSPYAAVIDAQGGRNGLAEGAVLDLRAPDYLQQVLQLRPQAEVDAEFEALIARLLENPELASQAKVNALQAAATSISQGAMGERWDALIRRIGNCD